MGKKQKEKKKKREKKLKPSLIKCGLILLLCVAVYSGIGFFVAPHVAHSILTEKIGQAIDRKVEMSSLRFNPFSFEVEINDFTIWDKERKKPFAYIQQIYSNASSYDLLSLALGLKKTQITGLSLHIIRYKDGTFNIPYMKKNESSPLQPEKKEQKTLFPFRLQNILLKQGNILFTDKLMDEVHTLYDFKLSVPYGSTLEKESHKEMLPYFGGKLNGTSFKLEGSTKPFTKSLASRFSFSLEKINLKKFSPYLADLAKISFQKGVLSAELTLHFQRNEKAAMEVTLEGPVTLYDIDMRKSSKPLLSAALVQAEIKKMHFTNGLLHIGQIEAKQLSTLLEFDATNTMNWDMSGPQEASASEKTKTANFITQIEDIKAQDSTVNIVLKKQGLSFALRGINLSADNIKTGQDKGQTLFSLANADLHLNSLLMEDKQRAVTLNFTPASLHVKNLDIKGSETLVDLNLGIQGKTEQKGRAKGSFNTKTLVAKGNLELKDVDATKYTPYYATNWPFHVASATLGGTAAFEIETKAQGKIAFSSMNAFLKNLHLKPEKGTKADITLASLTLENAGIKVSPTKEKTRVQMPDFTAKATDLRIKTYAEKWQQIAFANLLLQNATLDTLTEKSQIENIEAQKISIDLNRKQALPATFVVKKAQSKNITFDTSFNDAKTALLSLNQVRMQSPAGKSSENTGYIHAITATNLNLKKNAGTVEIKNIALSGLSLRNPVTKEPLFRVKQIVAAPVLVEQDKNSIHTTQLTIENPTFVKLQNADGSDNISQFIALVTGEPLTNKTKDKTAEKKDPQKKSSPFFFTVDKTTLSGGTARFEDARMTPTYVLNVKDIEGSLLRFSNSPGSPQAEVHTTGMVDGHAPLTLKGSTLPTDIGLNPKFHLSVRNMDLPSLSAYALQYFSYPVNTGQLSLEVDGEIKNRNITLNNTLYFTNLKLGTYKKSPDDLGVPVSLALALLSDSSNNMRLSVPVRGSLDNPNFHIGETVLKAIFSLLMKAVTSPFSLLGMIFGGGEDINQLEMYPGQTVLTPKGFSALETAATALAKRPRLQVEITSIVDPEADLSAMPAVRLQHRMKKVKFRDLSDEEQASVTPQDIAFSDDEYLKYLHKVYRRVSFMKKGGKGDVKEHTKKEMEDMLLKHYAVTENDLESLEYDRYITIKDALIAKGVDSSRIFLRKTENEKQKNKLTTGVLLGIK